MQTGNFVKVAFGWVCHFLTSIAAELAMPDLTEYIETSQAAEKQNIHVEHVRSPLGDARWKLAGDQDRPHLVGAKEIAG
jgi:hypothetical protein